MFIKYRRRLRLALSYLSAFLMRRRFLRKTHTRLRGLHPQPYNCVLIVSRVYRFLVDTFFQSHSGFVPDIATKRIKQSSMVR